MVLFNTKIMSFAFIDPILASLDQNGMCLYDCVIFVAAPLNSLARVDTLGHQNYVSKKAI